MSEIETPLLQRVGHHMATLLSTPGNWTTGSFARDERGDRVSPHDPEARCFCLLGASERTRHDFGATYSEWIAVDQAIAQAVARRRPYVTVAIFNDTSKYDDVLAIISEVSVHVGGASP